MKNSIKREQSQACLNFAERKNFRLQAKYKILMTLALLITAVGGAWAQEQSETFATTASTVEGTHFIISNNGQTADSNGMSAKEGITVTSKNGENITKVVITCVKYAIQVNDNNTFISSGTKTMTYNGEESTTVTATGVNATTFTFTCNHMAGLQFNQFVVYFGDAAIELKPVEGKTNEWTFTMPAYDVEIAPIYAPTAKWAKDKEVDQLPTAIEGIIAGTDDAIVKAGTVVEGQGTVMYFATTDAEMTAEKAAAADGWLATLPTAAGYDDATTVYVWYYIKGADTPQGEKATAENTFNDSEIASIQVTVLSNKFDIALKAANANTIESGKATVKVGDAAKTLDEEGQLKQVKMGSKVTLTAATGYKFRKAEGKKGIVKQLTIGEVTLDITDCTTWMDVIRKNFPKIESSVGYVWRGTYILKNNSGNVSTDAVVDPNATDYYWADDN